MLPGVCGVARNWHCQVSVEVLRERLARQEQALIESGISYRLHVAEQMSLGIVGQAATRLRRESSMGCSFGPAQALLRHVP